MASKRQLETAVTTAKSASCSVYVLPGKRPR